MNAPLAPALSTRRGLIESLPALVDRAAAALADARGSAEVLDARDMALIAYDVAKRAARLARAKQAHDELVAAAYRAQGDALLIESQAKMRLADEYDAAQERGEVATQDTGRPKSLPDGNASSATVTNLGLSSKDIHEARQIRDAERAEPGLVRRTVEERVDSGREPTRAAVRGAAQTALSFESEHEANGWFKRRRAEKGEAKRLMRAEKEVRLAQATIAASARIGRQLYGVIYADPPWRFAVQSAETGMDRSADNHYPTLSTEAICALAIPAARNCALFLWATVPMLRAGFEVLDAWGFAYKSHLVWRKPRIGTGYWARNRHEVLLIGTRGEVPAPSPGTQPDSVIDAPLGRHSEKPVVFAELIEALYPTLPKLEMFCRSPRPGWEAWGNEVSGAAA